MLAAGRVLGESLSHLYTPMVSCHETWTPRSPLGCFQLGSLTQQRYEKGNPDCILGGLWGERALKGERGEDGHEGCMWHQGCLPHFGALLLKMTEVLLVHPRQRVPRAWEPFSQDSCKEAQSPLLSLWSSGPHPVGPGWRISDWTKQASAQDFAWEQRGNSA